MTTNGKRLRATCPFLKTIPCNRSAIYRTIDGSCNNLDQPYWGRANTPYRRLQDPDYADGNFETLLYLESEYKGSQISLQGFNIECICY